MRIETKLQIILMACFAAAALPSLIISACMPSILDHAMPRLGAEHLFELKVEEYQQCHQPGFAVPITNCVGASANIANGVLFLNNSGQATNYWIGAHEKR